PPYFSNHRDSTRPLPHPQIGKLARPDVSPRSPSEHREPASASKHSLLFVFFVSLWFTPLQIRFLFRANRLWFAGERRAMSASSGTLVLLAGLLSLAGCETTGEQRAREFNEDGVLLFRQGDYRSARENFELALATRPEDPALLYNLGQTCDRLGDWPKAEQYYQQCLKSSPNHADCRHALAVMLYRTGRKEEAGRMIQDWLADQPNLADAYALAGWRRR